MRQNVLTITYAQFSFPTAIEVGPGVLSRLPDHIKRFGRKPYVVTDSGISKLPIWDQVLDVLRRSGISWEMTDAISPNPLASECEAAAAHYRTTGCDLIIGFGGGSALDGAKGIAVMAHHQGNLVDFDDALGGYERITDSIPPLICIPTTAGTGSEVGRSTVVVDDTTNRKVVVFSPFLMPSVALLDPSLMVSLPPHITAATGFDALTHNLEALVATGYNPLCDGLAMEGLALCHKFLLTAYQEPDNLDARQGMSVASLMGATAFQKGLGAAHSLAHPLSTVAGLHHGLANAIVLPYVIAFNESSCGSTYRRLERHLGLKTSVNAWILKLRQSLDIPHSLRDAGVTYDAIPSMTQQAIQDGCHATNPRPCEEQDLRALYEAAFNGDVPEE